jgi:hypothetical protein
MEMLSAAGSFSVCVSISKCPDSHCRVTLSNGAIGTPSNEFLAGDAIKIRKGRKKTIIDLE